MAGPDSPPPPPRPGSEQPGRKLLTIKQAARVLNTSALTVYRRIYAGELPAIDIGSKTGKPCLRVKETDLWAYIDARQVA
ncbi:MAG TPA: helix-turn-helix domain-containing protein [Jiangellaceae bacterium]|nr:helix-turn-helix domain-containing protein [Jiangellaceae bacterium]